MLVDLEGCRQSLLSTRYTPAHGKYTPARAARGAASMSPCHRAELVRVEGYRAVLVDLEGCRPALPVTRCAIASPRSSACGLDVGCRPALPATRRARGPGCRRAARALPGLEAGRWRGDGRELVATVRSKMPGAQTVEGCPGLSGLLVKRGDSRSNAPFGHRWRPNLFRAYCSALCPYSCTHSSSAIPAGTGTM